MSCGASLLRPQRQIFCSSQLRMGVRSPDAHVAPRRRRRPPSPARTARRRRCPARRWGSTQKLPPDQCVSCRQPCASLGTSMPRYLSVSSAHSRGMSCAVALACEQQAFDFVANHDVQRVGELIGLDANGRGLRDVHGAVQVVFGHAAVDGGHAAAQDLQQRAMNARLRPTVFSQKRDWLSWMPMDVPPARQV